MKNILIILSIFFLMSCTDSSELSSEKPTLNDYEIGEKWVWKWQRSVEDEIRAEGKDYQEVVKYKNTLGISYREDTLQKDTLKISTIINRKASKTPRYDWPLEVGKKWKYESKWENNEGTTGKTSQDVEVISFEELNVAAGKFMTYKIEYKGITTNSRGFKGDMKDTWWYCPALKTYIKHVNDDGYGLYTNELINYSHPSKK